MSDVTDATTAKRGPTPDDGLRIADSKDSGPVLSADGTPLKKSLRRALRMEKLRALALIAPLLIFVMISFIIPIGEMLFRSVENQIVEDTIPDAVRELRQWDREEDELPPEAVFEAMYHDLFTAAEAKKHTRLGSRLNYEESGMSSLFRQSGRALDDLGDDYLDALEEIDADWEEGTVWYEMMSGGEEAERDTELSSRVVGQISNLEQTFLPDTDAFAPSRAISELLPKTTDAYTKFAVFEALVEERDITDRDPWENVYPALIADMKSADVSGYDGPHADMLRELKANIDDFEAPNYKAAFAAIDEDWAVHETWATIKAHSVRYTNGYFLNAIDMKRTPDGAVSQPEDRQILVKLFQRTLKMSLIITGSCILLGYPIAWILANLPTGKANLLMILVLLPFWTSLLVRTSAWKVMLQQQGVINDTLVWLGLVADDSRLIMMNNATGTIIAMTHILLPFMILPLYSVMKTIPPSYLRAAKSLGATNWTAFWRVYFPQSVPGIGAGAVLVFILSIGYYITPELVGGTSGIFISNRIAYHISSSLNWGLAAALGSILLFAVLVLYWTYDRIVGIDNVKLG